jgi:hypothetical protein
MQYQMFIYPDLVILKALSDEGYVKVLELSSRAAVEEYTKRKTGITLNRSNCQYIFP